MMSSGVEVLKLQFSRAIEQTFEHFLDSWALPMSPEEENSVRRYCDGAPDFASEIPIITRN